MPDNINFDFISRLEGGRKLRGYVPAINASESGVTIATGFDLGQRSESDLRNLGLARGLIQKLKPYLGLKSSQAQRKLREKPITITPAEASNVDSLYKAHHVRQLKMKYNAVSKNMIKFSDLPREAQTVIASVAFQYGTNLSRRTPNFWSYVIQQDWANSVKELKSFQDKYPTRRKQEAVLLERIL